MGNNLTEKGEVDKIAYFRFVQIYSRWVSRRKLVLETLGKGIFELWR